jgi:hypothetical protein
MSKFWELWGLIVALIGTALALEATTVWPALYWPGVLLVYVGLIAFAYDGATGKWSRNKWLRLLPVVCALAAIWYWSRNFVMVEAALNPDAYPTLGKYDPGTNVGGIPWADHYEDLRLTLANRSDYDFHDVDLSLNSDLWVVGAGQMDNVCPSIQFFQDTKEKTQIRGMWLNTTDPSTGKAGTIPLPRPIDLTAPTGLRLICDKFPRHSEIKLVVVLVAFNHSNNGVLPQTLFAAKRLPAWFSVKGEYRALGRTRDVMFKDDFPSFRSGQH